MMVKMEPTPPPRSPEYFPNTAPEIGTTKATDTNPAANNHDDKTNNSSTTTTTTTSNQNGNNDTGRSTKKTADSDLKPLIIEFMRERPFLWNSKHPSYKDHKRREHEFQAFSGQIGCPVQEIKRIWHVLRTNFFRAHKLLLDKPAGSGDNGEKMWKYYLSMHYILQGTELEVPKDVRQTRSCRASKDLKGGGKSAQKELSNNIKNCTGSKNHANSSSNNNNNSVNNNFHLSRGSNASTQAISNSMINDSSTDSDEMDHLYARALTNTLKRFDPTTKEIIKLKFQEIIVNYMQHPNQESSASGAGG